MGARGGSGSRRGFGSRRVWYSLVASRVTRRVIGVVARILSGGLMTIALVAVGGVREQGFREKGLD